jgi:hypothetical protein
MSAGYTAPSFIPASTSGIAGSVNATLGAGASSGASMASGAAAKGFTGMIGSALKNPYVQGQLVSGAMQLGGGAMQGHAEEQAIEEEQERYNTNVGARLWPGRTARTA